MSLSFGGLNLTPEPADAQGARPLHPETQVLTPAGKNTTLVLTEHGAFLDGYDNPVGRERGTRGLLEQLAQAI